MERGEGQEADSIVDLLLADVRNGFCNHKFKDGNFNVTKVQKINLDLRNLAALTSGDALSQNNSSPRSGTVQEDPNTTNFVRGGQGRASMRKKQLENGRESSDTPVSAASDPLTQKRSRKSYATEEDASLIDFLMETDMKQATPDPQNTFDRYASLHRRRQERRERKKLLETDQNTRERAPSPALPKEGRSSAPVTPTNELAEETTIEPKPNTIRRTRSWLDRPSLDKALAHTDSDNDTNALVSRIKSRLYGKNDERASTPPVPEESPAPQAQPPSVPVAVDTPRSSGSSSRWRAGLINGNEHSSPLETILERANSSSPEDAFSNKEQNLQGVKMVPNVQNSTVDKHNMDSILKSREVLAQRMRNSLDQTDIGKILTSLKEDPNGLLRSKDDSDVVDSAKVSVSVREKISRNMGANIDHVLKSIESSNRPIDNFGVSSPMKRVTPEAPEIVAAVVSTELRPELGSGSESVELKQKRDKRKKRSTLVVGDVQAALRGLQSSETETTMVVANVTSNDKSVTASPRSPKTPPARRRTSSTGEKSKEAERIDKMSKDVKAAAKQAAKKNFRGARFGYKDMKSVAEIYGRCRSDVEKQAVDQALLDFKGSMSRSKSYDESVARRANSESEKAIRNSGSTPDTTDEKRALLRGSSTNRLSIDGRRNGLYIPSDESDTELRPEDKNGRRRPSSAKSDSLKSVSRLSLKSTNTSTETLQAERDSDGGESSPEQRRKSSARDGAPITDRPGSQRSSSATTVNDRMIKRSFSHLDRSSVEAAVTQLQSKVQQLGNEEENPLASVAKWRLKREQKRLSVYDNVSDNVNELKNDIGSRSSYASSYASSTDRDEGFESMSAGTMSQRTSLSSTLESEIALTNMGRREDPVFSKQDAVQTDRVIAREPVSLAINGNIIMQSVLAEDARKQRTESWTEETLRVSGKNQGSSQTSPSSPILSPDSGVSTSKEDLWSDDTSSPTDTKHLTPPADKQQLSRPTTPNAESSKKSVPSYMRSTNSSTRSRTASAENEAVGFKRDAAARKSFRVKESPLKRDTDVRASMRAEQALKGGPQNLASARGVRSSGRLSAGSGRPSTLSPKVSSRQRADSNVSATSSISTTSDVSSVSASKAAVSRQRPVGAKDSTINHSPLTARATPSATSPSKGLTRTQSLRVASSTSPRARTDSFKRTSTALLPEARNTTEVVRSSTPLCQEGKRPGTPSSDAGSAVSRRRSHYLEPTSASMAHKAEGAATSEVSPQPPLRTKSRLTDLTESSKAATGNGSSPTPPPRTKSLAAKNKSPTFTRHESLRLPKTSPRLSSSELPKGDSPQKTGKPGILGSLITSKKITPAEDHNQLGTVTEQTAAEEDEKTKTVTEKSPSVLKRIGIVKGKDKTSPSKKGQGSTASTQKGQDKKK